MDSMSKICLMISRYIRFYINDLCFSTDKFIPILFADDTTLISTLCSIVNEDSTENDLSNNINNELNKVQEWLYANKLSLNISKTKYMVPYGSCRCVPLWPR